MPARSLVNLAELAAMPNLVAVFCGRFSPPVIAALPQIHRQHLILLDPWAAGDDLVDNGYQPNYVFRLSLRDSDAMAVMLDQARDRGFRRVGMLLLNTSWGRSSLNAAERYLAAHRDGPQLAARAWFNWQDQSLIQRYRTLRKAGAEAILLVSNAETAAILVNEIRPATAGRPTAAVLPLGDYRRHLSRPDGGQSGQGRSDGGADLLLPR